MFYFFRFYYAEMRRQLWPRAPAKKGALGRMSKNFQVYFIHIYKFFKETKRKNCNRAKELYCDAKVSAPVCDPVSVCGHFLIFPSIDEANDKKWMNKNSDWYELTAPMQ